MILNQHDLLSSMEHKGDGGPFVDKESEWELGCRAVKTAKVP